MSILAMALRAFVAGLLLAFAQLAPAQAPVECPASDIPEREGVVYLDLSPRSPEVGQPVIVTAGRVGWGTPTQLRTAREANVITVTLHGTLAPAGTPTRCLSAVLDPPVAGGYYFVAIEVVDVQSPNPAPVRVTGAGLQWGPNEHLGLVLPSSPVPAEPLSLRIFSAAPSSPVIAVNAHPVSIDGNTIRVRACWSGGGFSVPAPYTATVGVPPLAAGRYKVEHYHAQCPEGLAPQPLYRYTSWFDFEVRPPGPGWPRPPEPVARVREYFHESFAHYFVTADENEQVLLDSGRFPGWRPVEDGLDGWKPTAFGFWRSGTARLPVCRFFSGQRFVPKSSHFYTAIAAECESVKGNPDWFYEGVVGYLQAPEPDGRCIESVPLQRMYNGGAGGAPNHRYTTWQGVVDSMRHRGWTPEGVVGCVPRVD